MTDGSAPSQHNNSGSAIVDLGQAQMSTNNGSMLANCDHNFSDTGALFGEAQPGIFAQHDGFQFSTIDKHTHPFQGEDFNPNPSFGAHALYGMPVNNGSIFGHDSAGKPSII